MMRKPFTGFSQIWLPASGKTPGQSDIIVLINPASVTAESSVDVPFKIAIVAPNGLTLQTADAVAGIASSVCP